MSTSLPSPLGALPETLSDRIVCKFGGTASPTPRRFKKCAPSSNPMPGAVSWSFRRPGKRHAQDAKITDLLLTCWHLASQGLHYTEPLGLIRERYDAIARDLGIAPLTYPLDEAGVELQKLARGEESLATHDWMAARGEFCHALLIAEFLGAQFVPSGECIRFDAEGNLDGVSYDNLLARMADESQTYVIPGFYGRDRTGRIKTFPRGGSDITGAVVARAVGASIYENWTDVSGLLMADPRVVENPRPISQVTYRELRELAYMGAQVLHEETIFPASEAGIPIQIKNTNRPDDPGTFIVAARDATEGVVGIAGRRGFRTIYIERAMMNQQRGFGRRVLEVLETNGVSFEHMPRPSIRCRSSSRTSS